MGVIYILTNPAMPVYVKIGYADDVEQRVSTLNSSDGLPFAFRIYATHKVPTRLSDREVHDLIDMLNPDLRSRETYNGKERVREFYAMSPKDAFSILKAMARIHGTEANLRLWELTPEEQADEVEAVEDEAVVSPRRKRFDFEACGISPGEKIVYVSDPAIVAEVIDNNHVLYHGEQMSLTALAKQLKGTDRALSGPRFFKYNGQILDDIPR